MKRLKCKDCGNTENFTQKARISEIWFCDSFGNMLEVIESYDCDPTGDFICFVCESEKVERVEDENHVGIGN